MSPNTRHPTRDERPNLKASSSMFSQLLKLIPRLEFEALVKKTKAE